MTKKSSTSQLESAAMTNVLIVCMGNICRSPMARAVLEKLLIQAQLAKAVRVDSAGTHASAAGERPDPRAVAALLRRGYEIGRQRSRRVVDQDFEQFDVILAMDAQNIDALQKICPPQYLGKVQLFLQYVDQVTPSDTGGTRLAVRVTEVPDPYYGNAQGFDNVLDLCEVGAKGLVNHLQLLPALPH